MVRNCCLSVCEYIANDLTTVPKVIVRESYLSFLSLYLTLQLLQVPLRSVSSVHSKSSKVLFSADASNPLIQRSEGQRWREYTPKKPRDVVIRSNSPTKKTKQSKKIRRPSNNLLQPMKASLKSQNKKLLCLEEGSLDGMLRLSFERVPV